MPSGSRTSAMASTINGAGDPETDIPALARDQIKRHEERIAVYEAMLKRFSDVPRARPPGC
jgi:signal transduction protein with GAF and PtsI domain